MSRFPFLLLLFFCFTAHVRSLSQPPSDSALLSSFYQGSANNCASIALIKAAMLKYGYNRILSYQKETESYRVILKDGTKLMLTEEELQMASEKSDFDTTDSYQLLGSAKDSLLFYTYLSYASIAKNIEQNGYWSCSDDDGNSTHLGRIKKFKNALNFITKTSFCTDNCQYILGLKRKDNRIYDFNGSLPSEKGIILYS